MLRLIRRIPIRFRLMAGFSVILAIVFLSGVITAASLSTLRTESRAMADEDMPLAMLSLSMALYVEEVQQWLTDVAATRERDGYEGARKAAEKFRAGILKFKQHYEHKNDPDRLALIEDIEAEFETMNTVGHRMAEAYILQGTEAGNVIMQEFDGLCKKLGEDMIVLKKDYTQRATGRSELIRDKIKTTRRLLIGQAVLFFLLCILIAVFLSRSIVRPITSLHQNLERIVAGNDLSFRFESKETDEAGDLSRGIDSLLNSMSNLVLQIQIYSQELTTWGAELLEAVRVQTENTSAHTAQIEESSAALEEISSTLETVDESITGQARSMNEIETTTTRFRQAIEGLNRSMQSLGDQARESSRLAGSGREDIEQAETSMRQISESHFRIQEITGMINEISEKTNLLALNASIEAARAGDQGRGFAVVASEISKLADHTASSVSEIQSLIEKTGNTVETGAGQVTESASRLLEIIDSVNRISTEAESVRTALDQETAHTGEMAARTEKAARISQEIRESSREQKKSVAEINESIGHMLEGTGQVVESTGVIDKIAGDISSLSSLLKTTADGFTISGQREIAVWSGRYSVGIDDIDLQHKELFRMVNELYAMVVTGDSLDRIGKVLDGLIEYTVHHFAAEEKLMRDNEYPDYEAHKKEHAKMTGKVLDYHQRLGQKGNRILGFEILTFTRDWLTAHILNVDTKYADYLQKRGVK